PNPLDPLHHDPDQPPPPDLPPPPLKPPPPPPKPPPPNPPPRPPENMLIKKSAASDGCVARKAMTAMRPMTRKIVSRRDGARAGSRTACSWPGSSLPSS